MKNRTLALVLILTLLVSFALVGCGGGSASSSAAPASQAAPAAADEADEPADDAAEEETEEEVYEEEETGEEEETDGDVNAQIAEEAAAMAGSFSEAYYADGEDSGVVFLLGDSLAALAFATTSESVSFVGEYGWDDDETMTIVDEANGLSITFGVTYDEEEGAYLLDIGDLGSVYVYEMSVDEGILAMLGISYGTTAVA